jgi:hypothetical protein
MAENPLANQAPIPARDLPNRSIQSNHEHPIVTGSEVVDSNPTSGSNAPPGFRR